MAPIPVLPLHFVVLAVVRTITPVLHHQVMPVRTVFMADPVMIVTVVPILDSDQDTGTLRSGVS